MSRAFFEVFSAELGIVALQCGRRAYIERSSTGLRARSVLTLSNLVLAGRASPRSAGARHLGWAVAGSLGIGMTMGLLRWASRRTRLYGREARAAITGITMTRRLLPAPSAWPRPALGSSHAFGWLRDA